MNANIGAFINFAKIEEIIYKFCGNRRECTLCNMHRWLMRWTPCTVMYFSGNEPRSPLSPSQMRIGRSTRYLDHESNWVIWLISELVNYCLSSRTLSMKVDPHVHYEIIIVIKHELVFHKSIDGRAQPSRLLCHANFTSSIDWKKKKISISYIAIQAYPHGHQHDHVPNHQTTCPSTNTHTPTHPSKHPLFHPDVYVPIQTLI